MISRILISSAESDQATSLAFSLVIPLPLPINLVTRIKKRTTIAATIAAGIRGSFLRRETEDPVFPPAETPGSISVTGDAPGVSL